MLTNLDKKKLYNDCREKKRLHVIPFPWPLGLVVKPFVYRVETFLRKKKDKSEDLTRPHAPVTIQESACPKTRATHITGMEKERSWLKIERKERRKQFLTSTRM